MCSGVVRDIRATAYTFLPDKIHPYHWPVYLCVNQRDFYASANIFYTKQSNTPNASYLKM